MNEKNKGTEDVISNDSQFRFLKAPKLQNYHAIFVLGL